MAHITDPLIELPGVGRLPISELTATSEARVHYLGPRAGNDGSVRCLCRPGGIPMGVGHRRHPVETYYLYPLHQADMLRHALGCPHRKVGDNPDNGSANMVGRPKIQIHGGWIDVDLAHGVSKLYRDATGTPTKTNQQTQPEKNKSPDRPKPSASLHLLAELLLGQAAITHWHPGFVGKRNYYVMRKRILEAVNGIAVRRRPLGRVFYFPPTFSPKKKDEINEGERQWFSKLKRTGNKQPYGFIAGVLKSVTAVDESHCLNLANYPRGLIVSEKMFAQVDISRNTLSELDIDADCLILAMVQYIPGDRHLEVIDIASVALTEGYIPVSSDREGLLVERLIENKRQFRKPLSVEYIDSPDNAPRPAFVLEDRSDRTCIELLPGIRNPTRQNDLRKMEHTYEQRGQSVVIWDTENEPDTPDLPPRDI